MQDSRFKDQTIGFVSDEKVTQLVRLLVISLSSVLPIISIVVLYVIRHAAVRLGVIIICSVQCSLALATLTNARNVEVLATTPAEVWRRDANSLCLTIIGMQQFRWSLSAAIWQLTERLERSRSFEICNEVSNLKYRNYQQHFRPIPQSYYSPPPSSWFHAVTPCPTSCSTAEGQKMATEPPCQWLQQSCLHFLPLYYPNWP